MLNPAIPGFQPELVVGGKPIARAMPLLEIWAKELGVRDLMSYYSESLEEAFAHIGENVPPGMKPVEIEWHDRIEALVTVRAYLSRLSSISETVLDFSRHGQDESWMFSR